MTRASWCTSQAASVIPRMTARRPSASFGVAIGIAKWISGDTASTPAWESNPCTLAATIPAARIGISLRSILSSLPLPMSMTTSDEPLTTMAFCIPLEKPAAARTNSTTSPLPPTLSTRRIGERPRLRTAYSKGSCFILDGSEAGRDVASSKSNGGHNTCKKSQ